MSAVSVLFLSAVVGFAGASGGVSAGGGGRGAGGGGAGAGSSISGGRGAGAGVGAGPSITAGRGAAGPSIGSPAAPRVSGPSLGPSIQVPAPTTRIQVPAPRGFVPSDRMGGNQGSVIRVPRSSPSIPSDDPTPRGTLGRSSGDDGFGSSRNGGLRDLTPHHSGPSGRDATDLPDRPTGLGRSNGGLSRDDSPGRNKDILGSGRSPYAMPRERSSDDDRDDRPNRGRFGSVSEDRGNHSLVPRDPPLFDGTSSWNHNNGSWSHSSCNCWSSWTSGQCWHHSHCFNDSWWCCGSGWGWSWGFFFCNDWLNPWCWYYWPTRGYPVYVYYPYPYTTYSYIDTSYVNERRDYPVLPTESYVDPNANQNTLIEQGKTLFEKGDYLGAAEVFRQAILKDLNDPLAKFGYAHALFALGNYPFSALAIRMGMKLLPDWPILGGDLRDLYGKPEDFTTQVKALDQYLSQRPDDPGALLVSGYVHYFSGDTDRAESAFERLLELDANDPVAQKFVDALAAIHSGQAQPPTMRKLQPQQPPQPAPPNQNQKQNQGAPPNDH